ncbi:MAG TPA: methanogenesis marker 8 protein [archaeon]|nr:methanogenesis marker 8 protein [archaeon]
MPHIMEILGKTRVMVKDGKVIEAGKPQITWCPLWNKASGIEEITKESAIRNMEQRIKDFGMFTPGRRLDLGVFASFGISEIMMTALSRGLIDSTVTVCDGAGTVVTSNPELVQGMSAQISGLIETEPISEVIEAIHERGGYVLDPESARIDQAAGLELAVSKGYSRIAVSVVDVNSAARVLEMKPKLGIDVIIMAAHLTGICSDDAAELLKQVDVITGCASKKIRELVQPLIQVGTAIPLFGLTQKGKELLIERAKDIESPLMINTMALPVLPEDKQPKPLIN